MFSKVGRLRPRGNAAPKVTEKGSRTGNKTHICSFPSPRLSHLLSQLVSRPALFRAGSLTSTEGVCGTGSALPAGSQVRLVGSTKGPVLCPGHKGGGKPAACFPSPGSVSAPSGANVSVQAIYWVSQQRKPHWPHLGKIQDLQVSLVLQGDPAGLA